MSSNSIIWMNVTTVSNWQRPPVGIIRVESELCLNLSNIYGNRFKTCIWNGNRFIEKKLVNKHEDYKTANAYNNISRGGIFPLMFPLLSKKKAMLYMAQGLLSIIPARVRPVVNRALYYAKPKVIRFLSYISGFKNKFPKIMNQYVKGAGEPNPELIFRKNDVLLSLGLDWEYQFHKSFYSYRKQGVKVVTCCYDLIPVFYPQYYAGNVSPMFSSYFIDIADGSDVILCISKNSESDLNYFLDKVGAAKPKTCVFPLGDSIPVVDSIELSSEISSLCDKPFILFVSTVERRKNHEVLYRAYHLLCKEGKREQLPNLVFVGMEGWGVSDLMSDIWLDPLTRDLITRLEHVSDSELGALYKSSLFCVFPSLYEGWGLPVGEALSLGKAVICSDRGSLPEVGGDLVRYADPWDVRAWADEIYEMATDLSWRQKYESSIRKSYKVKTWREAAEAVSIVIDSIL